MTHSPPTAQLFDAVQAIRLAQETFDIEAAAVLGLRSRVEGAEDGAFVRAVRLVLAVQGRVVVMGMGKSGHVGRKIAATLASTGTPRPVCAPGRGQPWRPGHGHCQRCGAGHLEQR